MKRAFALALLAAAALPLFSLPKVAVLDIIAEKGIDASAAVPVTESVMEEIVGTRAYVVLDRAYVGQILKEKEFQLSGLVGDSQVVQAGQYLGADYVVAGKVQMLGSSYYLVAKMIEVRTGVIVSQSSAQGKGELVALVDLAHQVGKKLASGSPISPLAPVAGAPGGAAADASTGRRIKAAFVFTPWDKDNSADPSYAQTMAIQSVKQEFKDWLDVLVVVGEQPQNSPALLDRLAEAEACDIVFTFDYAIGDQVVAAAARHPKVVFESLGGDPAKCGPNAGVVYFEAMLGTYMDGLVAGAMSSSGKVGFLSDTLSSRQDSVARINSFAVGVKAANPRCAVLLSVLPEGHWTMPGRQKSATEALLAQGCDVIYGVQSPEIFAALKAATSARKRALTLSDDFGFAAEPSSIMEGPTLDYYSYMKQSLLALRSGNWKRPETMILRNMQPYGGVAAFNPAMLAELKAKKVKTSDLGELGLLDLLDQRNAQAQAGKFYPLVGPLKDQKGNLRLKQGEFGGWDLQTKMDWLLDNVKGTLPPR
jgi:basic membrane protein A and related proteins